MLSISFLILCCLILEVEYIYLSLFSFFVALSWMLKFSLSDEWNLPKVEILGDCCCCSRGLTFSFQIVCLRFFVSIHIVFYSFGIFLPFLIISGGNIKQSGTKKKLPYMLQGHLYPSGVEGSLCTQFCSLDIYEDWVTFYN